MKEVMKENQWHDRRLNRDCIKYIAMAAMLLNHIATVFLEQGTLLAEIFLDIGYFTGATMCWFLVEGYRHTRSIMKYGLRLFVFAVISQYPFLYAFHRTNGYNMIYTLFICYLILVVKDKVSGKPLRILINVLLALATFNADWPLIAPVLVMMFSECMDNRQKTWRAYGIGIVLMFLLNFLSYSGMFTMLKSFVCALGSCGGMLLSALVIIYLYNGQRAKNGTAFSKWFFYIFYPAHLLVIGFLAG